MVKVEGSQPELKDIWKNMKEFSYNILGRAIYDSTFSEMTKPFAHTLAVIHAAHGTEILIKARIAQEHPLLIFKKLPKPNRGKPPTKLDFDALFEKGISYMYNELPELLWASTGYQMSKDAIIDYSSFFNLRNGLVHFSANEVDAAAKTLKFIFEVVDTLAWDFWGETFVEYAEEWDDVIISEGFLLEQLKDLKISVIPQTMELLKKIMKA